MNPRIRAMVESRQLEPDAAEDREVLARWRKAVRSYADSRKDLAPESAPTPSYQAGLQAATAIVRAGGYRVRSAGAGHRRSVAAGAGDERPAPRAPHAVYGWDDDEGPEGMDPARLDDVVRRLVRLGHGWLRDRRPAIAADLDPPPDG